MLEALLFVSSSICEVDVIEAVSLPPLPPLPPDFASVILRRHEHGFSSLG